MKLRAGIGVSLMVVVATVAVAAGQAGMQVTADPMDRSHDTALLHVHWEASGDAAAVALNAPEGVALVVDGGSVVLPGDRLRLGAPAAGQVLPLEVSGLAGGAPAFVAVDRVVGDVTYQTVFSVGLDDGRTVVFDVQSYRMYEKEPDVPPVGSTGVVEDDQAVSFRPSERTVVVESLQPKTAAVVFGEDPSNIDIPISSPTSCGPNYDFSTVRQINISSAPAGAVTTDLAIHIIMSHWDAGQMYIACSEDGYWWDPAHLTGGKWLWKDEASQVDIDQIWTRDKYNQELPGIGYETNGWFQLWFVDCTGGAVGTLDYWSVEATYDVASDVDLIADSLSVDPDPVGPGEDIRVTWSGHVGGTDSVPGPFTSRIYLSSDSNITTADTVLAAVAESTATNPGDTFGSPAPGRLMTLPGGIADGTWYVGVIVDYTDVIDESNESNNVAWSALTVDSTAGVDLVADSITPQSTSVPAGSSVNVNWFAHSAGSSSGDVTSSFSAGLYLSADANVTTGDTLLERATVTPPISPGQSFGDTGVAVTIPGGTAAGTRYLGLIVDDTSAVTETDENNNTAVASITVTSGGGGQPDLSPNACSVSPSSIEPGDSITISWTERNVGSADAGAFWTHVRRSANTTYEPANDPQLGQRSTASLAAGATASKTLAVSATGGLADGTYYALVVSDINDEVTESNENNNICYAAFTVDSGGGPGESSRWLIPAAASAPGTGGSDWRTQIAITNPTNQTREGSIYYVADNQSWPGLLLSGPISLGARQARYIDDVLLTLRPTTGLMYVVLDDSGPVVTSRTYNLGGDGSTFGQGIPGIRMVAGWSPDELILPMVHSGGGRFHTNVGLVQTSSGSITLEISIYTAGGSLLASEQRTVNTAWDQINDIFDKFHIGSAVIEGGWIRVRLVSGSPDSWMCYASIVDKETGDGTYIAGVQPQ